MYNPDREYSTKFMNHVEACCAELDINCYWLDGNHEHHDWIDLLYEDKTKMHVTHANDQVFPHIFYLPRGYRFELDGVKFMSYGGAFSVNRRDLTKFVSWFPQETIDLGHLRSLSDEHVDVMLTHDAPTGAFTFPYDDYSNMSIVSKEARDALYLLVQKTTPSYCFAGHHHFHAVYDTRHQKGYCRVEILANDGQGTGSWRIFDTAHWPKVEEQK